MLLPAPEASKYPELVVDSPEGRQLDLEAVLKLRIRQATALRSALRLPSARTNVYRLINRHNISLCFVG